nr:hypothetical protein [uncultured Actinoplanes sp.]
MLYVSGILVATLVEGVGVAIALGLYIVTAILWIVPDRRIDRAVHEYEKQS